MFSPWIFTFAVIITEINVQLTLVIIMSAFVRSISTDVDEFRTNSSLIPHNRISCFSIELVY